MQKTLLVRVTLGAIAEDAAIDRGSGYLHHAQPLDDGFIERLSAPLIGLAQEDAHELRFRSADVVPGLCLRLLVRVCRFDDGSVLHLDESVRDHVGYLW